MFTPVNGGRLNVPKLVILLTDGSQTQDRHAEDPSVISQELRKSGINIIVVGIGPQVSCLHSRSIEKFMVYLI